MEVTIPATGRLLGVDYGSVRVGIATCDPDRILAYPLMTIRRSTPVQEAAAFGQVIAEERIVGIVLGLPISLNGHEGPKAQETRKYGDWLATVVPCPIVYWDERFSSSQADDLLRAGPSKRSRHAQLRDQVAARILLQNYLESRKAG
jgi:putative Holliday junction resolvase